jgi:hypothetical protein
MANVPDIQRALSKPSGVQKWMKTVDKRPIPTKSR